MNTSHAQGLLYGRLADVGMGLREKTSLTVLTDDALKTSEIEGEVLNAASVRSSIARAIGDLLLARAEGSPQRFYNMSAQTQRERKAYYDILEQTQKGNLDVTQWLLWFLQMLNKALTHAHQTLDTVLYKSQFWQRLTSQSLNPRQVKVINRLLDGFEGKLTTSKWAALAKCSTDTALRDITELVALRVLTKSLTGGRSTSYYLAGCTQEEG